MTAPSVPLGPHPSWFDPKKVRVWLTIVCAEWRVGVGWKFNRSVFAPRLHVTRWIRHGCRWRVRACSHHLGSVCCKCVTVQIVTMDPFGHVVLKEFRDFYDKGYDIRPTIAGALFLADAAAFSTFPLRLSVTRSGCCYAGGTMVWQSPRRTSS